MSSTRRLPLLAAALRLAVATSRCPHVLLNITAEIQAASETLEVPIYFWAKNGRNEKIGDSCGKSAPGEVALRAPDPRSVHFPWTASTQ